MALSLKFYHSCVHIVCECGEKKLKEDYIWCCVVENS
jgi:hypothetical protein